MTKIMEYDFKGDGTAVVAVATGGSGVGAGGATYAVTEDPLISTIVGGVSAFVGNRVSEWWRANRVFDKVGGNDGELRNGAHTENSRLMLDGTDDFVKLSVEDYLGNLSKYTILGEVVFDRLDENMQMFSQSNTKDNTPFCGVGYGAHRDAARFWHFDDAGNKADPYGGTVATEEPTVIGGRRDGNEFAVVVNGSIEGTETREIGRTTLNTGDIGRLTRTSPGNYLNGSILRISVWDEVLTEEEMKEWARKS